MDLGNHMNPINMGNPEHCVVTPMLKCKHGEPVTEEKPCHDYQKNKNSKA